jgi:hypothetical protein
MRKQFVCVVLVAAAGAVTLPATAAGEPSEWSLEDCVDDKGKATTKITSGTKCALKNKRNSQCLIRIKQPGQADWGFASCDKHPRSMLFLKSGGGAIKCGDTVAMQLGWGGQNQTHFYRKCHNPHPAGINVCQDDVDKPESKHWDWQLQCSGGDLQAGDKFALYNLSRKDSVVYAKRPSAVADTCWADKAKAGVCLTPRDDD